MNVCPLETDSERVWADAGQRAAPANKTTATIVNITIWMSLRKVVIDWLLRDTRNHDGSSWKMQARNPRQSFCPQEAWRPQLLRKEPPIVCAVAHQMSVENQLRLARDSHRAVSVP